MNNFLVVTNKQKDPMYACTNQIRSYLERHGKICRIETGDTHELKILKGTECVIVLGGDGTLLRAARTAADAGVPLIGVNLGTLGYLAEVDSAYLEEALDQLIRDDFTREKRMMLSGRVVSAEHREGAAESKQASVRRTDQAESGQKVDIDGNQAESGQKVDIGDNPRGSWQEEENGKTELKEDCALNDIAITRRGSLQIITFHIYVNGQLLYTCHADGFLVATPTGSTGYNLSAG